MSQNTKYDVKSMFTPYQAEFIFKIAKLAGNRIPKEEVNIIIRDLTEYAETKNQIKAHYLFCEVSKSYGIPYEHKLDDSPTLTLVPNGNEQLEIPIFDGKNKEFVDAIYAAFPTVKIDYVGDIPYVEARKQRITEEEFNPKCW